MSAPSTNLDWTLGNPNFGTITVEPTSGKKQTGWTPGEPPPSEYMNWLFYNTDQWIKYLKSAADSQAAAIATLQASLFSTNMVQEIPTGTADGSNANFTLTQSPSSPTNTFVYVDSALVPRLEYTITGRNIVFNGGSIPEASSTVQAIYVIQTGFSGQNNSVAGSGATPKVENRVITSGELASKQIILTYAPFDPTATSLDLITEGPQSYGTDFTITGNVLTWSSLGLDGVVTLGDKLRILYFI